MKVPMQWIRQYTDIPVTPEEFESAMIMHGTGVEGLDNQNDAVQNVVVGKILSVRKHENSDHMVICSVDVGEDAPIQIVTGAPNVHEGDLVPVAKVGAVLPGGVKIKKGKLRGVESDGMCCSGPEIGVPDYLYPSVGDKGLLIFHEDYKPGTDVRPILGVDDTIVDFEILANRPDCLSVWGVAREAAVTLGTQFRKPEIKVETVPGKMDDYVHIDVQDTELCPRYCARLIRNVKIGPSPMWMRKALNAAGVRAINLDYGDEVVSMELDIDGTREMLVVSENGFGKRTSLDEYRLQTRGGKGIATYDKSKFSKTGTLVGGMLVRDENEVMLINSNGVIIRIRAEEISKSGRTTQGVKIMKVEEDSHIVSLAKVVDDEENAQKPKVSEKKKSEGEQISLLD